MDERKDQEGSEKTPDETAMIASAENLRRTRGRAVAPMTAPRPMLPSECRNRGDLVQVAGGDNGQQ